MKQTIKEILCCLGVLVILAAVLLGMGKVTRPVETDINVNAINTFHSMPKDSIEVMCYGSSRMWRGLNVMEMYDKYGIGAYNFGCNWQHINTTALFLHDSYKTQSPKLVIIEAANVHQPLMDVDMDGEIYYTKAIPWSKTKYECIRQYFGNVLERYLSYVLPLTAFHGNWENLTTDNFLADDNIHVDFYREADGVSQDEFKKTMGFGYTDRVMPVTIGNPDDFEQKEFEYYSIRWLDDIVNTCKENGSEVLFITMPYEGEYNYSDALQTYLEANGCGYLDFFKLMEEVGLDEKTDFCDYSHLNNSGAMKVADYLGKYISENYSLTDYRNVSGNLWEKAEQ